MFCRLASWGGKILKNNVFGYCHHLLKEITFNLFPWRKVRIINYPAVCPYVCLPHYKCLNQLVDFHEIQQRGMPFKVTSTPYLFIPWLQPFQNYGYSDFWGGYESRNSQCGTIKFCMLIGLERMNNFYSVFYEKPKKIWTWLWLKVKIHVFFNGDDLWTVALRQMKFGTVKDHGHTYKFCLMMFLNMGMVWNFEVMFGQTLYHSV
jgi:hypothetical protein